ncbi:hypothetical protein H0H93_008186, partial [Arthromyces matolae]
SVQAKDYFLAASGVTRILDVLVDPPMNYEFVGELNNALIRHKFQEQFTALNIRVPTNQVWETELALNKGESWKKPTSFAVKRKENNILLTHDGKDVHIPITIQGAEDELYTMWRAGPPMLSRLPTTTPYLFRVPSDPLPLADYYLAAFGVIRTLKTHGMRHAFTGSLKEAFNTHNFKLEGLTRDLTLIVKRAEFDNVMKALAQRHLYQKPMKHGLHLEDGVLKFVGYDDTRVQEPVEYIRQIPIYIQGTEHEFELRWTHWEGPPMESNSDTFPIFYKWK